MQIPPPQKKVSAMKHDGTHMLIPKLGKWMQKYQEFQAISSYRDSVAEANMEGSKNKQN